jgi:hypothetical protein
LKASRVLRACVLSFLSGVSTGCYKYTPVAAPPATGSQLLLDLNDRGRVGLGNLIGPSSKAVEGLLQPGPDSVFNLKVVSVSYLNGQRNQWSGEPLAVSRDFVRDVRTRQFSKSRTVLTAGSIVGAAVLFIVTRGLVGSGSPGREGGGDGEGGQS